MKVVNPADCDVRTDGHPTRALGMRIMLEGNEGSPENFVMLIADNIKRFEMVRHRHNFDQFRYAIKGDMAMGGGNRLREGELGYFPEGTPYGPQDDDAGRTAMVIQFGGASGYGYMSMDQYLAGWDVLEKQGGHFEGPVYVRPASDGKTKRTFSINAIWEERMGAKMLIPAPRYDSPVFMNPRAFRWLPVRGAPGVHKKMLGAFTERGVTAEMLRLAPGAKLKIDAGDAIRLGFIVEGAGELEGKAFAGHYGVQIDPHETATLSAERDSSLFLFTLPLIGSDWLSSEIPAVEPVPGESVAREAAE